MKQIILVFNLTLLTLTSCNNKQAETKQLEIVTIDNTATEFLTTDSLKNDNDSLFILREIISENFVRVIPPKNYDFEFPDSSAKTEPFKYGDFNADGKEDILVYFGACGTGGCMYGLFLNQYANFYRLVFFEYLKNAEFKIEKDGLWTIKSSEELEPYNPYKLQISSFKFNKNKYQYEMDTTFVYHDKEGEKMMKE